MEAASWIVVIPELEDSLVDEVALVHTGLEEFSAVASEASLIEAHSAAGKNTGGQACGFNLVYFASAPRTAELKCFAVCLAEEGEGHAVGGLYEVVSIAFGTDEDEGHWLVPEPSEAAPRGCHGVERIFCTCCNKHPLFAYKVKRVFA